MRKLISPTMANLKLLISSADARKLGGQVENVPGDEMHNLPFSLELPKYRQHRTTQDNPAEFLEYLWPNN